MALKWCEGVFSHGLGRFIREQGGRWGAPRQNVQMISCLSTGRGGAGRGKGTVGVCEVGGTRAAES